MTSRDPVDPLRTRLEQPSDALRTRVESRDAPDTAPSAEAEPRAQAAEVLTVLPKQLAFRFRLLSELPAAGAEANLLLVADEDSRQRVVKLYRRTGPQASREVWEQLPRLSHPHVVHILETGQAGQRDYELMEYVHGGNLAQFVGGGTDGPETMVTETVRQIASALSALHDVGIIHQDLKPENVLVRSRHPLDLALTDFGVSRVLDQTRAAATAAGTLAYLAPELLLSSGGQTSRARDWWALGMMARELLLGQRPFEDMGRPAIDASVMLRGIDLEGVTDARLRMLCAGLLTRDPEDRWAAEEVTDWLAGGSPRVATPTALPNAPAPGKAVQPLTLLSVRYAAPEELASALTQPVIWEAAARKYFTDIGPAHDPSEGWRALRKWLRQFDEPDTYDVEALQELVDHELHAPGLGPDARVVRLLRVLAPQAPAQCRGVRIDRENLLAVARHATAAQNSADEHVRLMEALWQQNLLPELAKCPGAAELRRIDETWRAAATRVHELSAWLRTQLPPPTQEALSASPAGDRTAAFLLCLLLDTGTEGVRLRQRLDQVSAQTAAVPWFGVVRHQLGADPAALAVLHDLAPVALAEAQQVARRTAADQAAHQQSLARWQHMEQQRVSPSALTAASTSALGPMTAYVMVMVVLALIGSRIVHERGLSMVSLVVGLICVGVQAGLEVSLARNIGSEYRRGYTLFSQAGTGFQRAGRPRGAGWGCLILLVAPCALSALLAVPAVVYVVLLFVHLRSLSHRRTMWAHQHAAAHARTVSGR
ncbi:serine/threonine-protein kinase [Streptomyces sp. CA-249302]|uniref:serine/threonine-protein kinase n=1 Tax=Streptomyces sp. CA-249302 TaxID=3240058 RepID=UPI003D950A1B